MTTFALSAPEIYGSNSGELVSMMKSAAETVAGAAALKAARAALAPSAELHAQISSIQGHDSAPARHMPTQISPESRNIPTLYQSFSSPGPRDTRERPLAPHTSKLPRMAFQTKRTASAPSLDRAQIAQTV